MENTFVKFESPKNTEGKKSIKYVNKNYIGVIEHYIGKHMHQGWDCSKISVNLGAVTLTCYDARSPKELQKWLNRY